MRGGAKVCKSCRSRQELSNHPVKNDDGDDVDADADQPGQRAAGVGDAVSTQKQPKKGCGIKEANSAAQKRRLKGSVGSQGKPDAKRANAKGGHGKKEAAGAASKRCRKDSSGDHGIACKKAKPK